MNAFPSEIEPFLTFFQMNPTVLPLGKFLETMGRVHGLTLIAMKHLRNGLYEEQFVQEDHFFKAYLDTLNMGSEVSQERPLQQVMIEFVQSTLGPGFKYA